MRDEADEPCDIDVCGPLAWAETNGTGNTGLQRSPSQAGHDRIQSSGASDRPSPDAATDNSDDGAGTATKKRKVSATFIDALRCAHQFPSPDANMKRPTAAMPKRLQAQVCMTEGKMWHDIGMSRSPAHQRPYRLCVSQH